jgi:hypothetical protein
VKVGPRDLLYATAAVVLAALAVFWLTMSRWVGLFDDAIPLVGAIRVTLGEVPHRDFYSNYGPAAYYPLAALFKLFGPQFLVARLYDAIIKAFLAGAVFYIVARTTRLSLAAAVTAITVVWIVGDAAYLYVIFPVMLLGFIGTWLLVPGPDGLVSPRSAAISGALTGAIALFRYDSAGFLAVAHGVAVTALVLRRPGGFGDWARAAGAYAAGCLAVFAPVAALFVLNAGLSGFLFDLFGVNVRLYSTMRRLPWPGSADMLANPQDAAVYLPLIALFLAALFLLREGRRPSQAAGASRAHAAIVLFAALTASFLLKGVVRVSIEHMLMAIIAALVLLAILAEQLLRQNRPNPRIGVIAGAAMAAILAVANLHNYPGARFSKPPPAVFTAPPVAPGALRPPFGEAAQFIANSTRPGERIFVGRFHHDRLIENAIALYFAAGRAPATHWHQFDPGLQTSAPIQRQIIGELERGHVRWLLLENTLDDLREPNGSAVSSGVTVLDDYIHAHYRLRRDWGVVQAWSRVADGERATR